MKFIFSFLRRIHVKKITTYRNQIIVDIGCAMEAMLGELHNVAIRPQVGFNAVTALMHYSVMHQRRGCILGRC